MADAASLLSARPCVCPKVRILGPRESQYEDKSHRFLGILAILSGFVGVESVLAVEFAVSNVSIKQTVQSIREIAQFFWGI